MYFHSIVQVFSTFSNFYNNPIHNLNLEYYPWMNWYLHIIYTLLHGLLFYIGERYLNILH